MLFGETDGVWFITTYLEKGLHGLEKGLHGLEKGLHGLLLDNPARLRYNKKNHIADRITGALDAIPAEIRA